MGSYFSNCFDGFLGYQNKIITAFSTSLIFGVLVISAHSLVFLVDLMNDANQPSHSRFFSSFLFKSTRKFFELGNYVSPINEPESSFLSIPTKFIFGPFVLGALFLFTSTQLFIARFLMVSPKNRKAPKPVPKIMIKLSSVFLIFVYWFSGPLIIFANNELLIIYSYSSKNSHNSSFSSDFATVFICLHSMIGLLVAFLMQASYIVAAQHLLVKKNPLAYVYSWNPLPIHSMTTLLHIIKSLLKYNSMSIPHMFLSFVYFNLVILISFKMHRFFNKLCADVLTFWSILILSLNSAFFFSRLKSELFQNSSWFHYPEPLLVSLVFLSFSWRTYLKLQPRFTRKMAPMFNLKSMTPKEIVLFINDTIDSLQHLNKTEVSLFWFSVIEKHRQTCPTFNQGKGILRESTTLLNPQSLPTTFKLSTMVPRKMIQDEHETPKVLDQSNDEENKEEVRLGGCFCTKPLFKGLFQAQSKKQQKEEETNQSAPNFKSFELLYFMRDSFEKTLKELSQEHHEKNSKKTNHAYLHISYSYFLYEYFSNTTLSFLYLNVASKMFTNLSLKERLLMKNLMTEVTKNQISIMSENEKKTSSDIEAVIFLEKQFFSCSMKIFKEVLNGNSDVWELISKNSFGKEVVSLNQRRKLIRSSLVNSLSKQLGKHWKSIEEMKKSYNQVIEISARYSYAIRLYSIFKLFILNDSADSANLNKSYDKIIQDQARYDHRPVSFKIDQYLSPNSFILRTSGLQENFGEIIWANLSSCALLKYKKRNDIIGKNFKSILPRSIAEIHDHFVSNFYGGKSMPKVLYKMRRGYLVDFQGFLSPIVMFIKPCLQITGSIHYSAFFYFLKSSHNERPAEYIMTFKDGTIDSMTKGLYESLGLNPLVVEQNELDICEVFREIRSFYNQIQDIEHSRVFDKKKLASLFDREIKGSIIITEALRNTLFEKEAQLCFSSSASVFVPKRKPREFIFQKPLSLFDQVTKPVSHQAIDHLKSHKKNPIQLRNESFKKTTPKVHESSLSIERGFTLDSNTVVQIVAKPKLFQISIDRLYGIILEIRHPDAKTERILKEAEDFSPKKSNNSPIQKSFFLSPEQNGMERHLKRRKSIQFDFLHFNKLKRKKMKNSFYNGSSSAGFEKKSEKGRFKKHLRKLFKSKESMGFDFMSTPGAIYVLCWIPISILMVFYGYIGLQSVDYGVGDWEKSMLGFRIHYEFFVKALEGVIPFYEMNVNFEEGQESFNEFSLLSLELMEKYMGWMISTSYQAFMKQQVDFSSGSLRFWASDNFAELISNFSRNFDTGQQLSQTMEFLSSLKETISEGVLAESSLKEYQFSLMKSPWATLNESSFAEMDLIGAFDSFTTDKATRSQVLNSAALFLIVFLVIGVVFVVMGMKSKNNSLVVLFFSNSSEIIKKHVIDRIKINNSLQKCIEEDFKVENFIREEGRIVSCFNSLERFCRPSRLTHAKKQERKHKKEPKVIQRQKQDAKRDSNLPKIRVLNEESLSQERSRLSNLDSITGLITSSNSVIETIQPKTRPLPKSGKEKPKKQETPLKNGKRKKRVSCKCLKYLFRFSLMTYIGATCISIIFYSEYLFRTSTISLIEKLDSFSENSEIFFENYQVLQTTFESLRDLSCPHIVDQEQVSRLCLDSFNPQREYVLISPANSPFSNTSFIPELLSSYSSDGVTCFTENFCDIFDSLEFLNEQESFSFKDGLCLPALNGLGDEAIGMTEAYAYLDDDFTNGILAPLKQFGFLVENIGSHDGVIRYSVTQSPEILTSKSPFQETLFQNTLNRLVFLECISQFLIFQRATDAFFEAHGVLFQKVIQWKTAYFTLFFFEIFIASSVLLGSWVKASIESKRHRSMLRLFPDSILKVNEEILLFLGGKKLQRLALEDK